MRSNILNLLRKFLTPLVLGLTSLFILRTIFTYWGQVTESLPSLSWITFIIAGLSYLAYFYFRAISWHFIIKALGEDITLIDNLSSWFLGEATRYIPGNIWSFVSRVYLANKKGTPRAITVISLALEIILLLVVTSIFSIPALISGIHTLSVNLPIRLLILVVALPVLIGLLLTRHKVVGLLMRLDKIPKATFISKVFILAIFFQILAWFFYGLGGYILIRTTHPAIYLILL